MPSPQAIALHLTGLGIPLLAGFSCGLYSFFTIYLHKKTLFNGSIILSYLFFCVSMILYISLPFVETVDSIRENEYLYVNVRGWRYPGLLSVAGLFQNLSVGISSFRSIYLASLILQPSTNITRTNTDIARKLLNTFLSLCLLTQFVASNIAFFSGPNDTTFPTKWKFYQLTSYLTFGTIIFTKLATNILAVKYLHKVKTRLINASVASTQAGTPPTPTTVEIQESVPDYRRPSEKLSTPGTKNQNKLRNTEYKNKLNKTVIGLTIYFLCFIAFIPFALYFNTWPQIAFATDAWFCMFTSACYFQYQMIGIVRTRILPSAQTKQVGSNHPTHPSNAVATGEVGVGDKP